MLPNLLQGQKSFKSLRLCNLGQVIQPFWESFCPSGLSLVGACCEAAVTCFLVVACSSFKYLEELGGGGRAWGMELRIVLEMATLYQALMSVWHPA